MNADFRNVHVTVVDFLGVLLPGAIWTLLLALLSIIVRELFVPIPTAANPTELTFYVFTQLAPKLGMGFYLVGVITVLIVGYVAKALAIKPSESLSTAGDSLLAWWKHGRRSREPWKGDTSVRFPYHKRHEGTPYFKIIDQLVTSRLGVARESVPRGQFFETCKRLLRLHAPPLWEEAERREAEVRMLASLFQASIFSLSLSLVDIGLHGKANIEWIIFSIISAVLLCLAFRLRRRREVESVYFATLAALPLISGERSERQAGKLEDAHNQRLQRTADAAR